MSHDAMQLRPSWVRKIEVTRVDGVSAPGECWLWKGAHNKSGHGRVCIPNQARTGYMHRVVYELLVGPIPEGLHLDHLCRQPPCCNPQHLDPVTPLINTQRGIGHGSETHCPQSHPYSGDNLHIYQTAKGGPRRVCRQCRHDYMIEYRALRKAARARTWAQYLSDGAVSA